MDFPYDLAFSRNLGFVTDFEQLALRAKRVAIAGMGGVGGVHLLTLARLGIGAFTIADADHFEFVNFNRQLGATINTVGRDKTAVLEEMARDINPELRIRRFDQGVTAETVDDFLAEANLYVDGLDFFEISIRRLVFARCAALGIPALTAAPLGMGVALILFSPDGMSFDRYFRLEGHPDAEQYLRFLLGLSPKLIAGRYLVDPTRVDLARHKGPSTIVACQLCAGFTAAAAVQVLLRRPGLEPAPCNYQFDPYTARLHRTRLAFGNAGPLQRLKLGFARRHSARMLGADRVRDAAGSPRGEIEEILNLARWAPSGDNSQPWRFHVVDPETVRVTIRHEPGNVYEYRDGEPTWLTAGILVETARIAATGWQRSLQCQPENPDRPEVLLLRFPRSASVQIDPLLSFLTLRSVDRRAFRFRRLQQHEKAALLASVGDDVQLDWSEDLGARWRFARLTAAATGIRLRCPEAFPVHRRIIDWDHALSPEGIPSRAVGLPTAVLPLMRLAMGSWERARWMNRLDGTLSAQFHLDLLPGLATSAWFVMRRPRSNAAATPMELIRIGGAIQRFWLTAARLGLAIQPTLAPIGFSHYGESGTRFSSESGLATRAEHLASSFRRVLGAGTNEVAFMGRIGEPRSRLTRHRSVRRQLEELSD